MGHYDRSSKAQESGNLTKKISSNIKRKEQRKIVCEREGKNEREDEKSERTKKVNAGPFHWNDSGNLLRD